MMIRFSLILLLATAGFTVAADSPRERISINDGWRFIKGDPTNVNSQNLLYDVRPVSRGEDQRERPAEATEEAAKISGATNSVLKPWILPAGNHLIKDPAKWFARPDSSRRSAAEADGNPGGEVPYVQTGFDDRGWRLLNLPHDWAIEGPFNSGHVGGGMGRLPSPGIGWYRKKLDIPSSDSGKSIFLDVDGAMSYATVWLNGKLIGGWPYGYASWRVDLTPYVVPGGENQLAIRLDSPPDSARWYPGGGIYRNVWLVKNAPLHIAHWGTYVTTPEVGEKIAKVKIQITVDNDSDKDSFFSFANEIYELDKNGAKGKKIEILGSSGSQVRPLSNIAAGKSETGWEEMTIANPKLWSIGKPSRYVVVTTISSDGLQDQYETPFGIRKIECKPDGLFVNGERIRIQGTDNHHDLGALGAAFNVRAAERQLQILRDMGCNAIRTAHNPPAPELLELTDRMGFLVMDEIFDAWRRQKTPFDFHLIFADWHEPDVRAFIRRDRNHPSVFLWSVGNEVGEQYTGEDGAKVARELIALAHEEDPSRPATASMNFAKPDSAFAAAVDVISLNYQGEGIRDTPEFTNFGGIKTPPLYPAFHEKFPDRMVVSSESAAALSSRGIYLFPVARGSSPTRDGKGGDSKIHQVSGYELYTADFGSAADKVFTAQDKNPYVAGEFVWCGWDYLGEPTPYYSSRSSYYGIIDMAGFKKDRFYLYQSRWRPDLPMAHILPHWTWPERVGQVTPVHVFTSGDEGELFLNGKSLGRKKKGDYEYRLRWDDVVYQPGTLKVVTYKNGVKWATDEMKTAGIPARLKLEPDRNGIQADGKDLSFVTVTVADKSGVMSPRADNRIHFDIEGPGEIVATDNGDPTSLESFQSHDRNAFNGLCLVMVRGQAGQPGKIRLTATATGLVIGTTVIQTVK